MRAHFVANHSTLPRHLGVLQTRLKMRKTSHPSADDNVLMPGSDFLMPVLVPMSNLKHTTMYLTLEAVLASPKYSTVCTTG